MDMGKSIALAGIIQSVGNQKIVMPDGFWNEWNRVCQRYRKYEWVKNYGPGVNKLVPVKRGQKANRKRKSCENREEE